MSIKLSGWLCLVLGWIAIGVLFPQRAYGQRPLTSRKVPIVIQDDKSQEWLVDLAGGGFTARRLKPGDNTMERKNFEAGGDWMLVSGKYMGYDITGKNVDVIPIDAKELADAGSWKKEGSRLGMRLQVKKGSLKDWWVGMQPTTTDGKPTTDLANLMLVKDKKDAAQFRWEDPNDDGR
jgi:hypothetical protein